MVLAVVLYIYIYIYMMAGETGSRKTKELTVIAD